MGGHRAIRRAARGLAAFLFAAAAATCAVPEFSGFDRISDGGAPADANVDVVDAERIDGSTDAGGDTADSADSSFAYDGSGGCAALPQAIFCADFEDGVLPGIWSSTVTDSGAYAIASDASV